MKVLLPAVAALRESRDGNLVMQLAAPRFEGEAEISAYTEGRAKGHVIEVNDDHKVIVLTNASQPPESHDQVVRKQGLVIDSAGNTADFSSARWIKHPGIGEPPTTLAEYKKRLGDVVASWDGAISYRQEEPDKDVSGLRPPQLGALFAAQSHFTVHSKVATIVMPTGTGKTETMLATMVAEKCPRLLVVVPTDALRTQIAEKFQSLGVLKECGVVSSDAKCPVVGILKHGLKTLKGIDSFVRRCNVVVTTLSLIGSWETKRQDRLAGHFSHLFIDEAHHIGAPTWESFRDVFSDTQIIQFTATPYRNDGKPVGGQLIFNYPLGQAQKDGYFKRIDFRAVVEFDPKKRDQAIAKAAVEQLRADFDKGHILMARVSGVKRAEEVFEIYKEHSEYSPVQMHSGIKSLKDREEIRQDLLNGKSRIVVCVDMLGEGFDLPELKIAAFHDIRQSLPITLQLAGRFTRSRRDLGNATIIANVADVRVKDELRQLYQRDVDWNQLLPEYSDKAIADEFDLWEFLGGFKKFPEELSLQNVRPAMSAVAYKTNCDEWTPENFTSGIPGHRSLDRVYHDVNPHEDTLVVLTTKKVPLDWAKIDDIYSWDWQLYILYWDRNQQLLFIHNSSNSGFFKGLAKAVCGEDVECVTGPNVFRCLATVNRLRLNNVGLLEQLGRLIRFTMRAGSDVEGGMTEAQKQRAVKSNLFGTGFENGHRTSIGCSYKGRIWSHKTTNLMELKRWCQEVGAKLVDDSLDPDQVLDGTLVPEMVSARPTVMPIGVDWPDLFYRDTQTLVSFGFNGDEEYLHETDIALENPSADGDIRIRVASASHRTILNLTLFQSGDANDFAFVEADATTRIQRGTLEASLSEFFNEEPPTIWFADGSSLRGNELVRLRKAPDPFKKSRIEAWDWSDVDITKESQRIEKRRDSIQFKVIQELQKKDFTVLFDDDDAGEAADVIGIIERDTEIDVEFYHCKFSGEKKPGARVDDLYVVCGQAQRSVRRMEDPSDIFLHMSKRDPRVVSGKEVSRFETGSDDDLWRIREKSRRTRVNLRVFIVQPGLSKERVSSSQLELLGVTENYLKETYLVSFGVIASE